MPIDLRKAYEETKLGLCFPCAMCNHFWNARKEEGVAACRRPECGGPRSGESFPSYDGPIPKGEWGHFCFICGDHGKTLRFRVADAGRTLGVCVEHQPLVDRWLRDVKNPLPRPLIFLGDLPCSRSAAPSR